MIKTRLYEVYDGNEPIGEMTVSEIAELTGKSKTYVYEAVSNGYPMKKRYTAVYEGNDTVTRTVGRDIELLKEFDRVTEWIRNLLKL